MSPRRTSYVVLKPPKGGSKMQSNQNLNNLHAITPKRYEIGCQLLLITNRKSHTGFRLIPTSMILNDLERRNGLIILCFFSPNSIALLARVVEVRPIMSVKYCLPVPILRYFNLVEDRPKISAEYRLPLLAKTERPCMRSFCDSWATLYHCRTVESCRLIADVEDRGGWTSGDHGDDWTTTSGKLIGPTCTLG